MATCWKWLLSLMLFLTLGMAQLPSPCQGDAHGGPCRPEACVCVPGCTCHAEHSAALAEAAGSAGAAHEAHAGCSGHEADARAASAPICPRHHRPMPMAASCHMPGMAKATPKASEGATHVARSCHTGAGWPNFSLPAPQWDAGLPPVAAPAPVHGPAVFAPIARPRFFAPPILAPPEPPPRSLA